MRNNKAGDRFAGTAGTVCEHIICPNIRVGFNGAEGENFACLLMLEELDQKHNVRNLPNESHDTLRIDHIFLYLFL
jgi:hypothetical protein